MLTDRRLVFGVGEQELVLFYSEIKEVSVAMDEDIEMECRINFFLQNLKLKMIKIMYLL